MYGLYERGGLAGAWRAVDYGHVLGAQHLVDGLLLRGVEVWEAHRGKGPALRFAPRVEEVAQVGQPPLGPHGAVERVEHEAVARLVERELHAHVGGGLQRGPVGSVAEGDNHAVAVGIAHRGGETEVSKVWRIDAEKHYRPAVLEVVLNLGVGGAEHFYARLVERVVVGAAGAQRPPCVAALHLAPHAHGLRLAAELLLLRVVFQLEQGALALQFEYGRYGLVCHVCAVCL